MQTTVLSGYLNNIKYRVNFFKIMQARIFDKQKYNPHGRLWNKIFVCFFAVKVQNLSHFSARFASMGRLSRHKKIKSCDPFFKGHKDVDQRYETKMFLTIK